MNKRKGFSFLPITDADIEKMKDGRYQITLEKNCGSIFLKKENGVFEIYLKCKIGTYHIYRSENKIKKSLDK